jgi:DNA repair protein SbcC/Rad50
MRLLSIELTGFRGFPRRQAFDLNADAVIVIGANGNGKTSLFDGILWALSGQIPRLSTDDSALLSMYSETGQARAQLRLAQRETGSELTVTRSFDGTDTRIMVETPRGSYQGASAEAQLLDLIWRDATSAANSQKALAGVLTRSVYLQQDVIREFLEADSDEERFQAVSELVR